MVITNEIRILAEQVRSCMSEKRFSHTLGVADFAIRMGRDLGIADLRELYVAALLHDVAKELAREEQIRILHLPSTVYSFTEEDLLSETLFHGFCAPHIVEKRFSAFASEAVLYAVCYHTVGREGMSLFEKIIFLADYMEEGRTYKDCVEVRNYYLERIQNTENKERLINECMLLTLDNTLTYLIRKGLHISPRTLVTRNAILAEVSHV